MSGECYSTNTLDMNVSPTTGKKYHQLGHSVQKRSELNVHLNRLKEMYANQADLKRASLKAARIIEVKPVKDFKCPLENAPPAPLIRQNSRAISTDTSGASLGTVNNILAGITKSIQLPVYTEHDFLIRSQEKTNTDLLADELHGVEGVQINEKSRISVVTKTNKTKFNTKKSKTRMMGSISSITNFKKKNARIRAAPERRKSKTETTQTNRSAIPSMNKRSRKILERSRFLTKNIIIPQKHPINPDLVEIYHNVAVGNSKSSDSDVGKKKNQPQESGEGNDVRNIPPLAINDDQRMDENDGVICCYKNYTMPTISSRLKQVAKYYMNTFNMKTIPFCPVTSTSPSHNIGINIQQVMSMVKRKHTSSQLSPTLAYNIGLAAGKWENNPLSTLIPALTSKSIYSTCPLSRSVINYQHLQEAAKSIPQDTIIETDENDDQASPETQSIIITGPTGDIKVNNKRQTVWTADANDKKCTCVSPKGMEFQQIVNKFNGTVSRSKIHKTSTVLPLKPQLKELNEQNTSSEMMPTQNKEKKLKEVLIKLHDEFEKMTKSYDDLIKKIEATGSLEANKKLEALDKELNSKEEEIIMVMSLYKEVVALKQQVKTLKESRSSKENFSVKNPPVKLTSYNSLTTAGLLNKLLQRIQHFQANYKKQ